jgi:hypothetical protein
MNDITTSGDAKAVSDLWALLADFETGFPVVEPAGLTQRDADPREDARSFHE